MAYFNTKHLLPIGAIALVAVLLQVGRFNINIGIEKWTLKPPASNAVPQTLSYLGDAQKLKNYSHISTLERTKAKDPDTTVVILNWSRLENVVQITKGHCHQSLRQVIASIYVWNNNPLVTLTAEVSPSEKYTLLLKQFDLDL